MATEILPGPLGEVTTAGTAGGGTALTGTAVRIMIPLGTKQLDLIPRNFAGAAVVQWLKCPWLTILKTSDALVGAANLVDQSQVLQDNSTSTSADFNSLDTAANGDFIYVGSYVPFSGVAIDIQNTNAGSNTTLTVKYRKSDNTWADISASDGTSAASKSFAQDGSVTWTVPSDWITARLFDTGDTKLNLGVAKEELYWTRWEVSVVFDSTVSANSFVAIPRSTTYHEIPAGMMWSEAISVDRATNGISAIQAKTDAGTANLIVDCAARGRFS